MYKDKVDKCDLDTRTNGARIARNSEPGRVSKLMLHTYCSVRPGPLFISDDHENDGCAKVWILARVLRNQGV